MNSRSPTHAASRSSRSGGAPRTDRRAGAISLTAIPLTGVGVSTLVLGSVSYLAGWRLGWIELMVVAGGCLVALVLALPFVLGRVALEVRRSVEPARVMVGEPAVAALTVANATRRRSRPVVVEDQLVQPGRDGTAVARVAIPVAVPALRPASSHDAIYTLPTDRRAAIEVGPARISRADPLGMFRREVAQAPATTLWVHPRWAAVPALPSGFAKDLEGPTSDTSPAGDIAFHALRPYQLGDDRRHIHWMSTARTGTLMVRHYVDNRRPALGVLLDTDAAAYDDAQFETAVEIATSLLMSSLGARLPVVARATERWLLGRLRPGSGDSVLEAMTVIGPSEAAAESTLLAAAADLLRIEPSTSAVAVITGGRPAAQLLRTVSHLRPAARTIVIPVDGGVQPDPVWTALPGARVLRVADLDGFRVAWRGLAG